MAARIHVPVTIKKAKVSFKADKMGSKRGPIQLSPRKVYLGIGMFLF